MVEGIHGNRLFQIQDLLDQHFSIDTYYYPYKKCLCRGQSSVVANMYIGLQTMYKISTWFQWMVFVISSHMVLVYGNKRRLANYTDMIGQQTCERLTFDFVCDFMLISRRAYNISTMSKLSAMIVWKWFSLIGPSSSIFACYSNSRTRASTTC